MTAISIMFFAVALDVSEENVSLIFLFSSIVYGIIGLRFSSKLIWLFSLLTLGSWFGAETGYVSGWGAYYLGMNYLCLCHFGSLLIGLSFLLSAQGKVSRR